MKRSVKVLFTIGCAALFVTALCVSSSSARGRRGGHGGGHRGHSGGHRGHSSAAHRGHSSAAHRGHSSARGHRGSHNLRSGAHAAHNTTRSLHSGGHTLHNQRSSTHTGHNSKHITHSTGRSLHNSGHAGHRATNSSRAGHHVGGHHNRHHVGHGGHHGNHHGGHHGHHGHLGYYGGHRGYFRGHPIRFGLNVLSWYGRAGYGFYGASPYGYGAPYYASYSQATAQPIYTAETQPLTTSNVITASNVIDEPNRTVTTSAGLDFQTRAEQAFRAGRYDEAARYAHHALVEMPRDGILYLFASQALFAVGDYQGAAAAVHQGVSLLEPNDWGYVVENYKNYYQGRDFVTQMDQLTEFLKENPEAAHAHFLRGYQHGFLGHKKTAIKELTQALELESRDQLAAQLINYFGGTPPTPAESVEAPPENE